MTSTPADAGAIWQTFERTVRADPDAHAVSTPGVTVSRQELATRASSMASAMQRAGVREHDVVLLMLPSSVAFVAAFLAIMRLPAVAALVSTRFRDSELRAICASVRPDVVLVRPEDSHEVAAVLDVASTCDIDVPGCDQALRVLSVRAPRTARATHGPGRFGLGDAGSAPALIKFSSGSTGAPKAVLWTQANVRAAAANVVQSLGLDASDRVLAPVPLSHSYGFDLGVLPLIFAGTSLAIRERPAWKAILAELAGGSISVFLGVPAMYRVLNRTRLDPLPDLSAVRYLLSCTAPLPVDVIEAFAIRFNAWIGQHYGSSETGGISLNHPTDVERHAGSVGRAMQGVQLRIVDGNGEALPPGRRGEVVIGGDATAAGYIRSEPRQDGGGFRDGRYWTGDVGFIDADGFLQLDGSRPGVAHVGGWKVSLAEVTRVLRAHPAVLESAVVALANSRGTKRIIAAVTLRDAADEAALIAFCRARLADYKVPRRVHILAQLPRATTGEVVLCAEHLPG